MRPGSFFLLLWIVSTARGELQIDIDTEIFRGPHVPWTVAYIGAEPPGTPFAAVMSGPAEGPDPRYHAVWTEDGTFTVPTPIHRFEVDYGCGVRSLDLVPPAVYIPGPANPPEGFTPFGEMYCAYPEWVMSEYFDHSGQYPVGWTTESRAAGRTLPWAPVFIGPYPDRWGMRASQPAFHPPLEEWLITPVIDLGNREITELTLQHTVLHAASSARLKLSSNNGVSWQDVRQWTADTSGTTTVDLSAWADGESAVRLAFVFTADFVTGGAAWTIDRAAVTGWLVRPVADTRGPGPENTPWNGPSGTLHCTWTHTQSVSGSSLGLRIDANGDGDYFGPAEQWQTLPTQPDAAVIALEVPVTFDLAEGTAAYEFRARHGSDPWAYSGSLHEESIADDATVSILALDDVPPTASLLYPGTSTSSTVTLFFSPTVEEHFRRYEVRVSPDSLVDLDDRPWTDTEDPALASRTTWTTTVTGLEPGREWYFRFWALDQAGNRSPASNRVRRVTEGSRPAPVTDLVATAQPGGILLSWTLPTVDVYGQGPVAIERVEIHSSTNPWFTPTTGTRIASTLGTSHLIPNPGGPIRACFKVVVVGAGPGLPPQGRLVAWGYNLFGINVVPDTSAVFVAVACGDQHNLALRADGTLLAWGDNTYGQCDNPEPGTTYRSIDGGTFHSMALTEDGRIVCFGNNEWDQCDVPAPNIGFTSIHAGDFHSYARRADGTLVGWGRNDGGQCNTPSPASGWLAIGCGTRHTIGMRSDSSLVTWGDNTYGQLDLPDPNTGYEDVVAGDYHNLVMRPDHTVIGWGRCLHSQCTPPDPAMVFAEVASGEDHSLGLTPEGTMVAWGLNNYGEVSLPYPNQDIIAIAAGEHHCLAIRRVEPVR